MKLQVLILAVALGGCASTDVQRYGEIDAQQRTITVPPGGLGLTGKIKAGLVAQGWQMAVYEGPTVTEGQVGASTNVKTSDTFNTRYRLLIDWEAFDICLNLQQAIRYDISIIDNKAGSEVATMSGRGCSSDVADQFLKLTAK